MKRKLSFVLIFSICCLLLHAQDKKPANNNFTLAGKVIGRDTGIIWLNYLDKNGNAVNDTTRLKNGSFIFKGVIAGPEYAVLMGDTKSRSSDDPNLKELFISPGNMTILLYENDFYHAKLTGSPMQADMDEVNKQKEAIIKVERVLGSNLENINQRLRNGKDTAGLNTIRDSILNQFKLCGEQNKKIDYAFITSHPASYLSPYLMNYYFGGRKLPLDSAQLFYNTFTIKVKNSPAGKSINEDINARIASSPGKMAPVFAKVDIDGKNLDLTSFRGKSYVILDFWASWCVPCRQATPYIKELYNKYHSKGLDVVSLSWDSDPKAWKAAINEDSTGIWHHLLANVFLPHDNGLRTMYAIEGIPTFVLIDKKGIIMGRWTGMGKDEEAEIDKMLATATN